MDRAGIEKPSLNEQQSADLFAYFYAHRYFEAPGEAGRGKQVFASARCGACHKLQGNRSLGAPPPVSQLTLESLGAYVRRDEGAQAGLARSFRAPTHGSAGLRAPTSWGAFSRTSFGEDESVFRSKGCIACHSGAKSLDQLRHRTLAGFSMAVWNHAPRMAASPPQLSVDDMRQLTGYLWSISYFDEAGAKVYANHGCQGCHASSTWVAPPLSRRPLAGMNWQT